MPFEILQEYDPLNTVIKVIGVGGGGGNAVEHMIDHGAKGIEFIAANTDHQALQRSKAHVNIQLGSTGLGAGARPEIGAAAAEEKREQIEAAIRGGTGTGAAPVIAEIAKELGILTVAVVTKPFSFEGSRRMRAAEAGIEKLKDKVDSMIVILNEKLESECPPKATMKECFETSNEVLYKACVGIAEIIHTPGTINVDFEDIKTVMSERGTAIIGLATASGENRARVAAEKAIACPLLEGANLQGARGLLVYFTGDESLTLAEIREAMDILNTFSTSQATVIFGSALSEEMGDEVRVTVVATGLDRVAEAPQTSGKVWNVPNVGVDFAQPVATPVSMTVPPVAVPTMTPAAEPQAEAPTFRWASSRCRVICAPSDPSSGRPVPAVCFFSLPTPQKRVSVMYFKQRTFREPAETVGIGLHSGRKVRLTLRPAEPGTGIVFRRVDQKPVVEIPSNPLSVNDTRMATTLNVGRVQVATVEHLMSALNGYGIDNAYVDVDAPEIPIMDGSGASFSFLMQQAGIVEQDAPKRFVRLKKTVRVEEGDKWASLSPHNGFKLTFEIDFGHPAIDATAQRAEVDFAHDTYEKAVARARTFGFVQDVEMLRRMGLAQGGSFMNAIVMDEFRVLNPEGLRAEDEFVKHKILDAMGDLYVLGSPLLLVEPAARAAQSRVGVGIHDLRARRRLPGRLLVSAPLGCLIRQDRFVEPVRFRHRLGGV